MLSISEKGYAFVAAREACVLTAYPDSRMLAVGFGQNDPSLKAGDTITMDEAIALFLKEGQRIAAAIDKLFPGARWRQHQLDAVFSATYNCGTGTLRDDAGFVADVRAAIDGPWEAFADLAGDRFILFHPHDKAVPFNLSRRRLEKHLFMTGYYGDISKMMLWPAGKSPRHAPPDPAQVVPMPTFLKG